MDGLKQRIVGALVIVSLAVIFLPMVFDEPHQGSKKQIIPIPIQPQIPVIKIGDAVKPIYKIVEPTRSEGETAPGSSSLKEMSTINKEVANVDDKSSGDKGNVETKGASSLIEVAPKQAVVSAPKKTDTAIKPSSVFNKEALKNVWMIQLGTFGNHKNAYALRDKLRKQGYDGHTTKIQKDAKTFIRVFSGPYADKGKADQLKKQIDKKFKVKSLVLHFE